jgi:cobalt-zinc-cadmium efflux system outer membrane protein
MRASRLSHCLVCILMAAPLAGAASSALAQAGPTLHAAVESAWLRSTDGSTLDARQEETSAARESARSWIAGNPTLDLSQRSDRWTERSGQRETEVSLSAPIWLPGQKSARQALAARSGEALDAATAQSRLAVAGEVRGKLWEVASARATLSEQQAHLQHLEAIANDVQRRVKAGDLARSDGLLARQEVLAAKADVAASTIKAAEALAQYRVLTGLPEIPAAEPEPLADAPQAPHPRLAAALAASQRAQAELGVVSASRSEPPTVGLGMRREQEDRLGAPARSVVLALQIPLGSRARNRPLEAAARTQIASAAAEAAQAGASVESDLALARQRLDNARQGLEAASARAALMLEHTALFERAFRMGELGLAELLRSRVLSHDAQMAERQQRVAVGLAHAQLNQALGVTP